MNIIFIAPPAAGKGTQSDLICEKYNLNHLSTGDLIRETIKKNDEQATYLKEIIEQGKLVSDDFILNLIQTKLLEQDGFIFDGFPRNINQAEQFDEMLNNINRKVDHVFYLMINKDEAEKRIVGRISCPKCGKVYNEQFENSKPKLVGICDNCESELVKRPDDNSETFSKRFDTYMNETSPVIEYYRNKGLLHEIDSNKGKEFVFKEIVNILGES